MITREVCLCDLVDEAIEEMPFARRRMLKFRMRFDRFSEMMYTELMGKLAEDERAQAIGLAGVFGSAFNERTRFSVDLEKLREILDLLLEYIPQIAALLMSLFG